MFIVELKNTLVLKSFSNLLFREVKRQGHSIQDREMALKAVSAFVPLREAVFI